MTEMPLLVFTILEQTAVGAFVSLVVMHSLKRVSKKTTFALSLVLVVLAVTAMIVSLFHLGIPEHAPNVLFGLGHSPISWEIVLFSLFTLCVFTCCILVGRKPDNDTTFKVVGIIGALIGIVTVIDTAVCYMLPGSPAWNVWTTPAGFVLTAVVVGVPLFAFTQALVEKRDLKSKIFWLILLIVFLIMQIWMRFGFYTAS